MESKKPRVKHNNKTFIEFPLAVIARGNSLLYSKKGFERGNT
jgi:hypothetical protein